MSTVKRVQTEAREWLQTIGTSKNTAHVNCGGNVNFDHRQEVKPWMELLIGSGCVGSSSFSLSIVASDA